MNKSELVEAIANHADINKKDAESTVNAFLDVVSDALKKGDSVNVTGFGSFDVTDRKARTGRNPQTGAPVQIPASKAVRFKAGKSLKDAVK